ncbi:MAG: hypothetical protein A2Y82_02740, partial [Candidatus Buchananbacteria bacterium RBG_13_36_9]
MKLMLKLAKNIKLLVLVLLVGVLVFIPTQIWAKSEAKGNNSIFLPENMAIEDIFWAAGQNLNINAQMKDDVYLAGVSVNVNGPIEGDLIVVGKNIVISSEIKGNLRAFGDTIIIKGKVAKNITIAGNIITLAAESEAGNNLLVAGSNIELNGKINNNLYAAGSSIILNNEILGNAYLTIDTEGALSVYPQANIHGNLEYTAQALADKKAGAIVGDQEKFTQWKIEPPRPATAKYNLFYLTWWLAGLLGAIIIGLVLVIIFKDYTLKVEKQIDKNILLTILKGLVYLIVTPIALFILAVTIIGLPLAVIMGLLYGIILYLTKIFVGIYLGERLIHLINKKIAIPLIWSMICGLVIIYLLCLLPYFGWMIKLIVVMWGLGVL